MVWAGQGAVTADPSGGYNLDGARLITHISLIQVTPNATAAATSDQLEWKNQRETRIFIPWESGKTAESARFAPTGRANPVSAATYLEVRINLSFTILSFII